MEHFSLNIELFHLINSWHCHASDTFFMYFRFLGNGWVAIPAALVVVIAYRFRRWKLAPFIVALVIETAIVCLLKSTVHQPRPGFVLKHVHLLVPLSKHSFPSGDAAMAFVIAFCVMRLERAWIKIALVSYAVLIAYGRIYVGAHFPLDVATGAVIGIASTYISFRIFKTKPKTSEVKE